MLEEKDPSIWAKKIFQNLTDELTDPEKSELKDSLDKDPEIRKIMDELNDPSSVRSNLNEFRSYDVHRAYQKAFIAVHKNSRSASLRRFFSYAAAVLILCTGIYLLTDEYSLAEQSSPETILVQENEEEDEIQLILGNGKQISLDTLSYTQVDHNNFKKENNILRINTDANTKEVMQHMIKVPYRKKHQIVLTDGTKVFLNAGSTLTFPSAFTDSIRLVKLQGEAFFEVAHMTHKPFIVETSGQKVRVLGTKFNVKAYDNDRVHYTTLLEGRVSLTNKASRGIMLSPGEQVQYNRSTEKSTLQQADNQANVAWMEGWLAFDNLPMDEILRQIGRWYNLEIVILDPSLRNIAATGKIKLYPNVTDVLQKFEKLGDAKFNISQNKIEVKK